MVIWGRGSEKAHVVNLQYYLEGENYSNYRLKYGFPELEVADNNFFNPRLDQWNSDIKCLVLLFSGLLKQEEYHNPSGGKNKQTLLREMDKDFSDASACIRDDSLKVYAYHCLAWTKLAEGLEEAQGLYLKILSINPNDPLALNNSGQLFYQDSNYLYANMRYDALLKEHDLPYVRIANAEVLTKLDRKEEALKEVEQVRQTPEYKKNKVLFDRRIQAVEVSQFTPKAGGVNELKPSAYLDIIAHRFSTGDRDGALRGLDSLTVRIDTSRLTPEDISVVRSLYNTAGAPEKATQIEKRATEMKITSPGHKTKPYRRQSLNQKFIIKQGEILKKILIR